MFLVQGNGVLTSFAFHWSCQAYSQMVNKLRFDTLEVTPRVGAVNSIELAFENVILKEIFQH